MGPLGERGPAAEVDSWGGETPPDAWRAEPASARRGTRTWFHGDGEADPRVATGGLILAGRTGGTGDPSEFQGDGEADPREM